jgi:hypothetical protein
MLGYGVHDFCVCVCDDDVDDDDLKEQRARDGSTCMLGHGVHDCHWCVCVCDDLKELRALMEH